MRKEKQITRCLTLKLDPILFATKTFDFLNILFPRSSTSNRWKFQDRRPAGRLAKKRKKRRMDKDNNSN